jgi:hypothetical protein
LNFNKKDVTFCINLPKGEWKKTIDSSEEIWKGQGSLMPEMMEGEQELTIRAVSFALYEIEVST